MCSKNFLYFFLIILVLYGCQSSKEKQAEDTIKILRDSLSTFKKVDEPTNPIPQSIAPLSSTKYVFSEIQYSFYEYFEYVPEEHSSRGDFVSHWTDKRLMNKTSLSSIIELKDYSEDKKYRFLDDISKLIIEENTRPGGVLTLSHPTNGVKILDRKIHEFDSYADASIALQSLK